MKVKTDFGVWFIILMVLVWIFIGITPLPQSLLYAPWQLIPLQVAWLPQLLAGALLGSMAGGLSGYWFGIAGPNKKKAVDRVAGVSLMTIPICLWLGKDGCTQLITGWRLTRAILPFTWIYGGAGVIAFLASYTWALNQRRS